LLTLTSGARFGSYDVLATLGVGGMGEVYRARDTRLGREVALKILPASVAADPERLARFDREARLLAALTHPRIATLHALEQIDGRPVLVMELVPGEDLSQRIDRGPVPVPETLTIAIQIALALEAAHEKGIVHRDLKPANIKLTDDGEIKVLDFGLAKAFGSDDPSSPGAMNSPTLTAPPTAGGVILGTAAYMSPEQARGRAADKRADIWAFGAVVFEMLTGQRLFQSETVSDTLAAVLRQDVDFSRLPAGTPPALTRVLRRCLERDPRNRLHDIADARIVLEDIVSGRDVDPPAPAAVLPSTSAARAGGGRLRVAAFAAAAFVIGAAGMYVLDVVRRETPSAPFVRMSITNPPGVEFVWGQTLAPDGSFVVFVGSAGQKRDLFVLRFDEPVARRLEHTQGAGMPFVSANGRWVGFFRNNGLHKVAVDGGDPLPIAQNLSPGPGTVWLPDGTIVLPATWVSGLMAIAPDGTRRALTTPDPARQERAHWFPAAMPDGRHLLFTIQRAGAGLNSAHVAWLDLHTGKYSVVTEGALPFFVEPGYLVFFRAGGFHAVAFDPSSGTISGTPVKVLEDASGLPPQSDHASFSVAANGTVVYKPHDVEAQLVWVAAGGARENLPFAPRRWIDASLSPDDRRIIAGVVEGGRNMLRLLDLEGRTEDALSIEGNAWGAQWHPDGHRIAFAAQRKGDLDAYWLDLATGAPAEPLLVTPADDVPLGWLADGRAIVAQSQDDGSSAIFLMQPGKPDSKVMFSSDLIFSTLPRVSPNGRWLAYMNRLSGQNEVYVRPIASAGQPRRISTDGAQAVAWSPTGKELYLARPPDILVAPWHEDRDRFVIDKARLFARVENSSPQNTFFVAADGRMLIELPVAPPVYPFRVVMGWQRELERKLRR
jgi:serine/threonine-protein kinase